MLVSIDDITKYCPPEQKSCFRDQSTKPSSSNPLLAYNRITIKASQFTDNAQVRFTKAVYAYRTHRTGYAYPTTPLVVLT